MRNDNVRGRYHEHGDADTKVMEKERYHSNSQYGTKCKEYFAKSYIGLNFGALLGGTNSTLRLAW